MFKYRPIFPIVISFLVACISIQAADVETPKKPTLHFVATAHLDTEWRWDVRETIRLHLPATLNQNFELFEKYPDYLFNFDGAIRYQMMKEYYPTLYEKMKEYIDQGRWHISGPGLDVMDVNLPAPESVLRNILLAQEFYEKEFGRRALDAFLPDCFGFNYAFPTLARHSGLIGFSTQKLGWGVAGGIPFLSGFWRGVDGALLPSVLHGGPYDSIIREDYSHNERWLQAAREAGEASGVPILYRYYGVGDQGGAPDEASVSLLQETLSSDGPLQIISARSSQFFEILNLPSVKQQPIYDGELLLTDHGVGGYSSKAVIKRWNRSAERLSYAAEQAATSVSALLGAQYPAGQLRDAWTRLLWHQHHDGITGTSWESTNEILLNDIQIAKNQFAGILQTALAQWGARLTESDKGIPMVVYNPLRFERNDIVDATIPSQWLNGKAIGVFTPGGESLPVQEVFRGPTSRRILFPVDVPPSGVSVVYLRPSDEKPLDAPLANLSRLKNERYTLSVNSEGQISSMLDHHLDVELLDEPVRIDLLDNHPREWPEWEIEFDQIMAAPRSFTNNVRSIKIVEEGPIRSSLRVTRELGDSVFTDDIRVYHYGPTNRIQVMTTVNWHSTGTLAKIAFPFSVESDAVTYDLGVGTVRRPINSTSLYEVPAHHWADLSSAEAGRGVAILSASTYGWDFPSSNTLRKTLLHSPSDITRDMGRHQFTYEIFSHASSWTSGVQRAAAALNHPLEAVLLTKNNTSSEESVTNSLFSISGDAVKVLAVKKSEEGNKLVIRLVESHGQLKGSVELNFNFSVSLAEEMNGLEDVVGPLTLEGQSLHLKFSPYQIRTIALNRPESKGPQSRGREAVELDYNADITRDPKLRDGALGEKAIYFSSDLWPDQITSLGVQHQVAVGSESALNAVACKGQTIVFPSGEVGGVSLLFASMVRDSTVEVSVDGKRFNTHIPFFAEPVSAWDKRKEGANPSDARLLTRPPFLKEGQIAWVGNHAMDELGQRVPHTPTSIYQQVLPLEGGPEQSIQLPDAEGVYLVAASTFSRVPVEAKRVTGRDASLDVSSVEIVVTPDRDFVQSAEVSLIATPEDSSVYFTVDGSMPTTDSTLYKGPFSAIQSMTVRAIAVHPDKQDHYESRMPLRRHLLHDAVRVSGAKKGLRYDLYKGTWNSVPSSVSDLVSVDAGLIPEVGLPASATGDQFMLDFNGYIHVPETGIYTFALTSDDGSILNIHGKEVVNNDGIHGALTRRGSIALEAGFHPFNVRYFESSRGEELSFNVFLQDRELLPHENVRWVHSDPDAWDRVKEKLGW